jgi:hypothetical protein
MTDANAMSDACRGTACARLGWRTRSLWDA